MFARLFDRYLNVYLSSFYNINCSVVQTSLFNIKIWSSSTKWFVQVNYRKAGRSFRPDGITTFPCQLSQYFEETQWWGNSMNRSRKINFPTNILKGTIIIIIIIIYSLQTAILIFILSSFLLVSLYIYIYIYNREPFRNSRLNFTPYLNHGRRLFPFRNPCRRGISHQSLFIF